LALLKSYYDESKSHYKANPRTFVVAGCTMSSESWLSLENAWKTVLMEFDISIFRSSDCNASKGEFVGWDGKKKDALRSQLIETIHNSWRGKRAPICPVFIWCIIDENIFEQVLREYPNVLLSPYELCVNCIVAGSRTAITNIKGENTIELFFEKGQDVRPHIRQELRTQRKSEPRIENISFVNKLEHIPLQVADMIAFEAWKSHTEGIRKVLLDLMDSGVGQSLVIDEELIRITFSGRSRSYF